jgi:hypothetical protein
MIVPNKITYSKFRFHHQTGSSEHDLFEKLRIHTIDEYHSRSCLNDQMQIKGKLKIHTIGVISTVTL